MADNNAVPSTTIQFGELVHRVDPTPEVKPAYRFSNGRTFYEGDAVAPEGEEQ